MSDIRLNPTRAVRVHRARGRPAPSDGDTRPTPPGAERWMAHAETAETPKEALFYLNRALIADPKHPLARQRIHQALRRILKRDAFLAYVAEDDALYQVNTGDNLLLLVPKNRAVAEPYPRPQPSPLRPAYRWLTLAILGLPLAGLGALIGVPMVLLHILRARQRPLSPADRVRSSIVLGVTYLVALVGLLLVSLLMLHL
jgi:hypothetical protein